MQFSNAKGAIILMDLEIEYGRMLEGGSFADPPVAPAATPHCQ